MASKRKFCAVAPTSSFNFKTNKTQDSCKPAIEIHGEMAFTDIDGHHSYLLIHPLTVTTDDGTLDILSWPRCTSLLPSSCPQSSSMTEFKTHANHLLAKPLESLVFNSETLKWHYINDTIEESLSARQKLIAEGFKYGMATCRGRAMIQNVLQELLADKGQALINVINCGGGTTSADPLVRKIKFTFKTIIDDMTSSSRSEKSSPIRVHTCQDSDLQQQHDNVQCRVKRFVPDIVVERRDSPDVNESLIVVVKRGKQLTQFNENYLKYQLIPSAIRQGTSLGLLVCDKAAVLIKYTLEEKGLRHKQQYYDFHEKSPLKDFVELMCDLYHHTSNV